MLKPKLELEIVNLMNYELVKNANNHDYSNLDRAVDYLNSAIDTLEEIGFTSYADNLLNIIYKIATVEKHKAQELVSLSFINMLREMGYPIDTHLKNYYDPASTPFQKDKAKLTINQDIRNPYNNEFPITYRLQSFLRQRKKNVNELPSDLPPTEEDIKLVLGDDLYMPLDEVRYKSYIMSNMLGLKRMTAKELEDFRSNNPSALNFSGDIPAPPTFETMPQVSKLNKPDITPPESIVGSIPPRNMFETSDDNPFKDIKINASKKYKPKNPTKVSDRHTKNLTSKKMIKNLKNHGTVFNMVDTNMADDLLDENFYNIDFEDEI